MAEERPGLPRTKDQPPEDEEEWVEEKEAEEQWIEDVPTSGAGAGWEEEEPGRPAPKAGPKGLQAYYSWIAGLIGLIFGLLTFRACQ